jgi:hypothetical protein
MSISIRCTQAKHSWSAIKNPGFKCEGLAYPGGILADPVPCECNCHLPGAKPDDVE